MEKPYKVNFFIDLDGTILDIEGKYNSLFSLMKEKYNLRNSNYWKIRSSGIGLSEALLSLGISRGRIEEFRSEWAVNVERLEFLEFDRVIEGAEAKLISLLSGNNLILCTARANALNLNSQLLQLGISGLFKEILIVQHGDCKSKSISNFYQSNLLTKSPEDWMIGDTSEDIRAGISVGLKTCGVLTGLANTATLKETGASQICDSLRYFQP